MLILKSSRLTKLYGHKPLLRVIQIRKETTFERINRLCARHRLSTNANSITNTTQPNCSNSVEHTLNISTVTGTYDEGWIMPEHDPGPVRFVDCLCESGTTAAFNKKNKIK